MIACISVVVHSIINRPQKGKKTHGRPVWEGKRATVDDLLLLTMVDICCEELEKIDMKLNVMKSQVVRMGRSHSKAANDVVIGDKSIGYVDELK